MPELRSRRWFSPDDLRSFGHRSRFKGLGFDDEDFQDRPIIALLNTWSELNTCHGHFPERAEQIRRGILQAGGLPVEVPVMSLGEMMMKPTTMLYRNLLSMEVEEVLRCHPIDAAVLMGGCDKTVPALMMGAISAGVPSLFFPAGPALKGRYRDQTLGSGSDAWKYWDLRMAGECSDSQWNDIENCIARSHGTCMTMGTASTMACIAETMGWSLPGAASIPSVTAEHARLAVQSGRRAVDLARQAFGPDRIATREAVENGLMAALAIGGSTNAIVHMIAIAGRADIELTLDDFDEISRRVPVLADLRPSGRFLMEDFHHAGGLAAVLSQLADRLHLETPSVSGLTLGQQITDAEIIDHEVIRSLDNPLASSGGVCVLRGNLAPAGCVIKTVAADKRLLQHTGPAVVFENYPDMKARVHSPDLEVTPDSILVLKSAGPKGGPGMPEWGMLPIPKKLLQAGVRDMVRISDARMSGTSYGTCVLHVAPESADGGPMGLLQDGDLIKIDVENRQINMLVSEEVIAKRRSGMPHAGVAKVPTRGYRKLFDKHVLGADEGCDFDFLRGGNPGDEPEIH
ncbi:MAG: IlvD/Edd family dehydratase [Planctomycetota bacterium]